MRSACVLRAPLAALLGGAVVLALAASPAFAQSYGGMPNGWQGGNSGNYRWWPGGYYGGYYYAPGYYPGGFYSQPPQVSAFVNHAAYQPVAASPCPCPCPAPMTPAPQPAPAQIPPAPTPPAPKTPETPAPKTPETPTTTPETQASAAPALSGESGAAVGGGSVAVGGGTGAGYVDPAIPHNTVRLRFNAAYDDNRPDRAEFFYPKCGCFMVPNAKGPPKPETSVDYQDIDAYLEVAYQNRFSGFISIPYRFLNPEVNANVNGFSDLEVGAKAAIIASDCTFLTAQLRTYIPTGDGSRGLGTDHVSLEPALLVYQSLGHGLIFEGEAKDWIPIGGSDFAGNVLEFGASLSYWVIQQCNFRAAPVVEVINWTVLGGKELDGSTGATIDAAGEDITNLKLGVRVGFGKLEQPGYFSRADLYVGYGRALTGDVWYKNLFRAEFRINF